MMEDNFRVRVDKIFGGLGPSLWSLTDQEQQLQRRRKQDHDESQPSDPLDSEDEEEVDDDEIDDDENKQQPVDDEYWDVKSNIGRDPTLDYEEEEDEYDKVALGSKHLLYMKDVKTADYDQLDTDLLPITFKDPRANHAAAKIRLQQDAHASDDFHTLQLSDSADAQIKHVDNKDGHNPKPILKKRETPVDSSSQKRVRFLCQPEVSEPIRHDLPVGDQVSRYSSAVPDYVNNPSKYTCYTFDSSDDVDHQSNQKAYMDFFQYIRKTTNTDSSSKMDDHTSDVPKSVTFIPKVKPVKMSQSTEDDLKNKGWSIGVTAEGAQESQVSAMDEDESCLAVDKGGSLQKPGRQYRPRTSINVEDSLT